MRESDTVFNLLAAREPTLGSIRVLDSEVTVPAGRVLWGRDAEDLLHLLIPLISEDEATTDRRSAGVQLRIRRFGAGGGQAVTFLDLVCLRPHLNGVFALLADEILSEMGARPDDPSAVCQTVLNRWRELFERAFSARMSGEALRGLIGELIVLRRMIDAEATGALTSWVGPSGHRFDFLSGTSALETKASTGREGRSVEIHGVDQLDPPPGGELYLAFLRLEAVPGGAYSVPGLIDELIESGISRHDLHRKLVEAGFPVTEREEYVDDRFELRDFLIFLIDGSMPRIVPSSFAGGSVPEGVSQVRYRVDLDRSGSPPLDDAAVASVLQRVGSPR